MSEISTTSKKKKGRLKKDSPFYLSESIVKAVKNDLLCYDSLKETATTQLTLEVNLHSPGNITNPGAGRPSTISRPVEQAVELHQKRLDEIEKARNKINAIERGIQESSDYASTAIRRDIRNGIKQMLIGQRYAGATTSMRAPKTLRKYYKMAIFFIAYYMKYIEDKDLEGRIFPDKIQGDFPVDRKLYPWEKNAASAVKTMECRDRYDEERKKKKNLRIEKYKEKRNSKKGSIGNEDKSDEE